jgi:hypothetical protein
MRFALLVQDRTTGGIKIAKRGRYADCLAARKVLTVRYGFVAVVWAVSLQPEFAEVTGGRVPGAHRGGRPAAVDLRPVPGGRRTPATPENAGTRFATRPFLRVNRPSAN